MTWCESTSEFLKIKKTLRGVEIKTQELDATIHAAIEGQKNRRRLK
jgi:hypothetical protein